MALINITPTMTSNTTPAPYVTSVSSSLYTTSNLAWNLFNGENAPSSPWCAGSGAKTGWIKIDYGTPIQTDAFSVYAWVANGTPSNFTLYGSNDDVNYEQIVTRPNELMWNMFEGRLFKYQNSVTYRYYKIIISSTNNNYDIQVGAIKFWQDNGITTYLTNKKASAVRCLPSNSTLAMTQRANDPREGLLGYANDGDNYGTLWMVDNKGKAIIPMAKLANADILFGGAANAVGSYNTSGNFSNYKYLLFKMSTNNSMVTQLIKTSDFIATSSSKVFVIEVCASSTTIANISLYYKTDTSFTIISASTNGYSSIYIEKIYGIK